MGGHQERNLFTERNIDIAPSSFARRTWLMRRRRAPMGLKWNYIAETRTRIIICDVYQVSCGGSGCRGGPTASGLYARLLVPPPPPIRSNSIHRYHRGSHNYNPSYREYIITSHFAYLRRLVMAQAVVSVPRVAVSASPAPRSVCITRSMAIVPCIMTDYIRSDRVGARSIPKSLATPVRDRKSVV